MFEHFTEPAYEAVVFAREKARSLEHKHIGSEHLLLGLLRAERGVAAGVLRSLGLTLERSRDDVVAIVGSSEEVTSPRDPLTRRAKKVLELALREGLSSGDGYVGTAHILLGLTCRTTTWPSAS